MINEATIEDVRSAEQRKRRVDDAAATMPEPELATIAARDPRESPVKFDPDPERRLLMKSSPSAASHSGQQKEKESVTNTEPECLVRNVLCLERDVLTSDGTPPEQGTTRPKFAQWLPSRFPQLSMRRLLLRAVLSWIMSHCLDSPSK